MIGVAAGFLVLTLAYGARAARLNWLLPPEDRIGFMRAAALSGAGTFLLQVIPFRGGEVASWALYKRELGVSWIRAGAVFALVKMVDSSAILLVGLAGASLVAVRHGAAAVGGSVAMLVGLGAVALVLLPAMAGRVLSRLAPRLPEGTRRRGFAENLARGLQVAHERPAAYALALGGAVVHIAGHVLGLKVVMWGLGVAVSVEALAFATLTSVLSAAFIPAPAGTFGTAESGFAAALALDGMPIGKGLASGLAVHLVIVAAAGVVGLPLLRRPKPPVA